MSLMSLMRRPLLAQHLAALRALLVLTVLLGLGYPLAITGIAQLPGLRHRAGGSIVSRDGRDVASSLIGQSFTDKDGKPLAQYFQSRPSAAGKGYDPTSTSASNLGPDSVVDAPDAPSLLSQVCARSAAVGALEHVDGARPYCAPDGRGSAVGAVLAVFRDGGLTGRVTRVVSLNQPCPATPFQVSYHGVPVQCAHPGEDYTSGVVTPVRGGGHSVVPADAVTASASGLDPDISPGYAYLQVARVARTRGVRVDDVRHLVAQHTSGRTLGFLGEPVVNVVQLNLALDQAYPARR